MQQRDLFDTKEAVPEADRVEEASFSIRSGRVGVIRFGATATSFVVTRDALTDLNTPPDPAADPS